MVDRGRNNSVDILPLQQLAIVLVRLAVVLGGDLPGAGKVQVGDSHEAGLLRLEGGGQHVAALAADADAGNADTVIGPGRSLGRQHSGRNEIRRGNRSSALAEELATGNAGGFHGFSR